MKALQLFSALFVCMSIGTVLAQIPTEGLIRYYPFNGTANDYSGNEENGTVAGATLDTDRFGNINSAYRFNKFLPSYISIPATGLDLNQFSYSAWAYLNSSPEEDGRYCVLVIGSLSGDHAITYNINFHFVDTLYNGWGSHSYSGGFSNTIYKGISASLNQWYHLLTTRSLTASKFYINGILVDSVITPDAPFYGVGPVEASIGMRYNFTLPFDGKLDDLRIYNRALNENEISSLYSEGLCYQLVAVTDTLIINIDLTGINPSPKNNSIEIYPNPTNEYITIDYGNYKSMSGFKLKLINSLGETLFFTPINTQKSVIDFSFFTGKGLYFVQILDAQNRITEVRKIVLR